jgi:hypothetical protein
MLKRLGVALLVLGLYATSVVVPRATAASKRQPAPAPSRLRPAQGRRSSCSGISAHQRGCRLGVSRWSAQTVRAARGGWLDTSRPPPALGPIRRCSREQRIATVCRRSRARQGTLPARLRMSPVDKSQCPSPGAKPPGKPLPAQRCCVMDCSTGWGWGGMSWRAVQEHLPHSYAPVSTQWAL